MPSRFDNRPSLLVSFGLGLGYLGGAFLELLTITFKRVSELVEPIRKPRRSYGLSPHGGGHGVTATFSYAGRMIR
jgi:hypothetical protein